jgi:hypothetical protein
MTWMTSHMSSNSNATISSSTPRSSGHTTGGTHVTDPYTTYGTKIIVATKREAFQ